MNYFLNYLCFSAIFVLIRASEGCKGCLQLDEHNFDKILNRFDTVLVKFDVSYPYGDKHETFSKLASELTSNDQLLFAMVGIKDYGDKENEELGKKYGITKDDLPALRLFAKTNRADPVKYTKDEDWSINQLRTLIRDNTDIYIGLPGCLEDFDKLSAKFVGSRDKKSVLKEAEKALKQVKDSDKGSAEFYVKYMKKILESGPEFVSLENARLSKIVKEGKVNEKKKSALENRLNILKAFAMPKDEL